MARLAVAVCALALLACFAPCSQAVPQIQLDSKAPWFCHGLDCPKFEVVSTSDSYEEREYKAGVWASTEVDAYNYAFATGQGFRKLFKYIDGGNEEGVKIPMTSPVLVEARPSCGPFCKQNFTVNFFVPFHLHDNTPAPLDPSIKIVCSEPFTAYVAQSGGFVLDDYSVERMAKALTEALDAEGVDFQDEHFYVAGYDPPFRLQGRHNEVWVKATAAADQDTAQE